MSHTLLLRIPREESRAFRKRTDHLLRCFVAGVGRMRDPNPAAIPANGCTCSSCVAQHEARADFIFGRGRADRARLLRLFLPRYEAAIDRELSSLARFGVTVGASGRLSAALNQYLRERLRQ